MPRRPEFYPGVRKIPWRRKQQPTPVFSPEKSHGQEDPGGLQSMASQRVRHNWPLTCCVVFWHNNICLRIIWWMGYWMNGTSLNTTSFWKLLPLCAPKEPPTILFHERTDSGWKESLVYHYNFWSQHPMSYALRTIQLQHFIFRAGFKVSFIHTWKSVFLMSSAMYLSFFSFLFSLLSSPIYFFVFVFVFGLWDFSSPTRDQTQALGRVLTTGPSGNALSFSP